ncbi:MAG: CpsD/CapB family tyrosine-protein kinase [Pseudomonadota bacterium]|nr:CpsD/CapB family tyrosine-protein kinase [Pseudomonadota bacterium]
MSTPSPTDGNRFEPSHVEVSDALIAELGLTDVSVQKIYEVMQSTGATFPEAAAQLGILRPETIEQALYKVKTQRPAESAGMIETAIRRISSDRRIVLRQGERVTPGQNLILAHDSDNPRSERLRALRTELLLLHETGRGANIVAVLSPSSGEGRSQLSAELAISFAQLGRRTLLVDADMRKPQQHVLFGSANQHGLSQSIAHNEKPYYNPVANLPFMHLLTAGPIPPNPLELLSDGRFGNLLAEWRNSYEFIVFDTPPVAQCADGLAVATVAARALVLSRAQHTTYKSTRALLRRLATTQSRLLGAVINHF